MNRISVRSFFLTLLFLATTAASAAFCDTDGNNSLLAGNYMHVSADSLLKKGRELANGDNVMAEHLFRMAYDVAKDKENAHEMLQALVALAELSYRKREFDRSVELYEQAFRLIDTVPAVGTPEKYLLGYGHALAGAGTIPEGIEAFHRAFSYAQATDDSAGSAVSARALGITFIRSSHYDSALVYYRIARDYHHALGNRQREGAMINSMGASFYRLGMYVQALEQYRKALEIRRSIGDMVGVSRVLNNIGLLYGAMDKYEEAASNYREAIEIAYVLDDAGLIGYSHSNMGLLAFDKDDLETALEHFKQALAFQRMTMERTSIVQSLNNIGYTLARLGRIDEAMPLIEEGLEISESLSFREGIAMLKRSLAVALAAKGRYREAYENIDISVSIAGETKNRQLMSDTYKRGWEIAEGSGDYKKALSYFKNYAALKDSLHSDETAKNLDRLKIEYESERIERDNVALRRLQANQEKIFAKNRIVFFLNMAALAIAVTFLGIMFFLNHRMRTANKDLDESNRMISEQHNEIDKKNKDLQEAIDHIDTLSGLLPICSSCKKIRSDDGYWEEVEGYVTRHSEAVFSHGICPDCIDKLYPELKLTEAQKRGDE